MSVEVKAPERAHVLKLDIGADSIEDLRAALDHIIFSLHKRTSEGADSDRSVSGGYNWGGTWEWKHNPEMTHDRFTKQLDEYLAETEVK